MIKAREKYFHQNQLIYEWEQTIDDVHIYFFPPKWALSKYQEENIKLFGPGFRQAKIKVKIESQHLTIQLDDQKPFIDVD